MTYQLSWQISNHILHLELEDEVTFADYQAINQAINDELNNSSGFIILIIDVSRYAMGMMALDRLRDSLTFMYNKKLEYILIQGAAKLVRLMMLVIFSLSNAGVKMFQNVTEVDQFVRSYRRSKSAGWA
ncbi:MAG: hypothetical protein H7Y09_06755 [Chitinophagaceae bacterium]|nr:hypothetical protein [Anaerolineae bacterium]